MKISTKIKKALNSFSTKTWVLVPIGEILQMLENSGEIEAVDEDGTPWSGMLVGNQGSITIDLCNTETRKMLKSGLHLQWYRLNSGKFEINAYIM